MTTHPHEQMGANAQGPAIVAAGGWCAPSEVIYDIAMRDLPDPTPEELARWETEERQDHEKYVAKRIETCCEVMHDAYEKAAVGAGWETNKASRKPWAGVPEANKVTMRAAVKALLDHLEPGWDVFEDDET